MSTESNLRPNKESPKIKRDPVWWFTSKLIVFVAVYLAVHLVFAVWRAL